MTRAIATYRRARAELRVGALIDFEHARWEVLRAEHGTHDAPDPGRVHAIGDPRIALVLRNVATGHEWWTNHHRLYVESATGVAVIEARAVAA